MARNRNTDRYGYRFDDSKVEAVWRKGKAVAGKNSNEWRQDMCDQMMYRRDYGEQTQYGWEIDHIKPVSKGGSDDLTNLQPLQWENNRRKADKYPWNCE